MSTGMISQEKFDHLPDKDKLGIIYECLLRIEKRKWIHNGFAATGGMAGGAITLATYLQFFH